jgi:hypothetical protein
VLLILSGRLCEGRKMEAGLLLYALFMGGLGALGTWVIARTW